MEDMAFSEHMSVMIYESHLIEDKFTLFVAVILVSTTRRQRPQSCMVIEFTKGVADVAAFLFKRVKRAHVYKKEYIRN